MEDLCGHGWQFCRSDTTFLWSVLPFHLTWVLGIKVMLLGLTSKSLLSPEPSYWSQMWNLEITEGNQGKKKKTSGADESEVCALPAYLAFSVLPIDSKTILATSNSVQFCSLNKPSSSFILSFIPLH